MQINNKNLRYKILLSEPFTLISLKLIKTETKDILACLLEVNRIKEKVNEIET